MKKEARIQALKVFLKHGGKVTNRQIADQVKVNALTVGRWKREDDWDTKLKEQQQAPPKPAAPSGVIRKKVARDRALARYLEVGGNITNKDLADYVEVSPATISKWKEIDQWIDQIQAQPVEPEEPEVEEEKETAELNVDELVSLEQILEMNRKIDVLLKREYLTASEIADLADAKCDLLEAVELYLTIVRETSAMRGN